MHGACLVSIADPFKWRMLLTTQKGGVFKTSSRYLRMADIDADGKIRMGNEDRKVRIKENCKIVNSKKNNKKDINNNKKEEKPG